MLRLLGWLGHHGDLAYCISGLIFLCLFLVLFLWDKHFTCLLSRGGWWCESINDSAVLHLRQLKHKYFYLIFLDLLLGFVFFLFLLLLFLLFLFLLFDRLLIILLIFFLLVKLPVFEGLQLLLREWCSSSSTTTQWLILTFLIEYHAWIVLPFKEHHIEASRLSLHSFVAIAWTAFWDLSPIVTSATPSPLHRD